MRARPTGQDRGLTNADAKPGGGKPSSLWYGPGRATLIKDSAKFG